MSSAITEELHVVGEPEMKITKLGLSPGAAGSQREIHALEQDDVQVLLVGETREWETVEYAADAVSEGRNKALIVLGHVPSEQPGMEECARWLKGFVKNLPVEFVPAKQPFWVVHDRSQELGKPVYRGLISRHQVASPRGGKDERTE